MNKTQKNYLYNLLYQGFVILLPLVTAPYLARTLGPEMLGTSGYITTVASIFTTFGMIGLNNYSIRQIAYVKDDRQKVSDTIFELLIIRAILCIVTSFVYFVFAFHSEYRNFYLIQYMYVFAFFIDSCWVFIGMEKMGTAVLRNFIMKFFTVLGMLLLIKNSEDITKYVFLLSFMTLASSLCVLPQLRKYLCRPQKPDKRFICRHLKMSLLLFLPQVATLIYLQADKVMIKMLSGSISNIAFYDQAEKIVKMPLTFITVLSTVMMPRIAYSFSQKEYMKVQSDISNVMKFSAFLAFPMMFGVAGIAVNLIPWYLGDSFMPVTSIIILLSPLILINSFSSISGAQYFTATNQTKILTIAYSAAAVVNLAINYLLIPVYGGVGAAIGTLCAELISLVLQYVVLLKQLKLKAAIAASIRYGLLSIPTFIVVIVIGALMGAAAITTVLQIVCGAGAYLLVLLLTKDEMLSRFVNIIKHLKSGEK